MPYYQSTYEGEHVKIDYLPANMTKYSTNSYKEPSLPDLLLALELVNKLFYKPKAFRTLRKQLNCSQHIRDQEYFSYNF